ncbi:nucleotide-binding protein [Longimicrobium sp.]|uniref:nucleotide-binding protein n=1 Tax=Longimicrobium sp. TaxID=2029185 RepID=UPI003B3A465E
METYFESGDEIFPTLKKLIRSAEQAFLGIGVAFDQSMRLYNELIQDRMRQGVEFTFVCLSSTADFQFWAPRFGQGVVDLEKQVDSSLAALEGMRMKAPERFSYHPTKECPTYRIYIADPETEHPSGIVVFYGAATDSPAMPAVHVSNFLDSPFRAMYFDSLKWMHRQLARKVFVIHGHHEAKRRELETLLREFGVEPVVLVEQMSRGAATIIEKFEDHAKECSLAIALFTPDDTVVKGRKKYLQPRPNAIFEVGWFCSQLGRRRVILLTQGEMDIEAYNSNLSGVVRHVFHTNVEELHRVLKTELTAAGLIT